MKNLLINTYFDGMTLDQAIAFITRCYGKAPTEKQIQEAKQSIKNSTNVDWK
jgi:hypothetical protein